MIGDPWWHPHRGGKHEKGTHSHSGSTTSAVEHNRMLGKTLLDARKPVTLSMWHVYGEQADSPMNRLIKEFNETVGAEKGVIIDVTLMSNASQIGQKLLAAQDDAPGVPNMPDLFFCHSNNAEELGVENLINWKNLFSEAELESYVPEFLEDGMCGDPSLE